MRVLITGGYGFIGSCVARHFYQEGHDIFILDNLSSGDKRHVEFKHKSSCLSVEERNCEELFRMNRFDVVVHMAGQSDSRVSWENPQLDTKSNLLGLSNMLALSHKYGVKKFIFASSAAVIGRMDQEQVSETVNCDPISPYGMNKWAGETYCRNWQAFYGLPTLCFRMSHVYGPRQVRVGDEGTDLSGQDRLRQGKAPILNADMLNAGDYIYVEDVAEAVYRSSYSDLTGVYHLSGGSRLDNRKLMRDLDWAPRYSVEEGLRLTNEWLRRERPHARTRKEAAERQSASHAGRFLRLMLPYMENGILFALTVWLTIALNNTYTSFIDLELFYILVTGIMYGTRQSILSVALSIGLYAYIQIDNGREIVSMLYDTDMFFRIAVYLFVGLAVGYTVDRKTMLIEAKDRTILNLTDKHRFLTEVYNETRLLKEELHRQIMNNGESFGKMYAAIKELDRLEPDRILPSAVSVVESVMKSMSVSIYTVSKAGAELRLAAYSNGSESPSPKSIRTADASYIRQLLLDKRIFANKEMRSGLPLLAAPVMHNGEIIAVVLIHQLTFEHFTLHDQNLLKIVTDLISASLARANVYAGPAASAPKYAEGSLAYEGKDFPEIA